MIIISMDIITAQSEIVKRYLERRSFRDTSALYLTMHIAEATTFDDVVKAFEVMKEIDNGIHYNSARPEYAPEYLGLVESIYHAAERRMPVLGTRTREGIPFTLALNHMQPVEIQTLESGL